MRRILAGVDSAQAISNVEIVLRGLIAQVLADEFGAQWINECGTPEKITKWQERQSEEAKKRDGTVVEERLIYFADFTDLLPVINKHWPLFKTCLGDKKTFETYMGRLEDFRNAPMHSRALVAFEQQLIEGMTGEIRNKVTLFQTDANAVDRHFPRIEFVRDSFGREMTSGIFTSDITLHPGDEVSFECSAWDPQDRPVKWTWDVLGGPSDGQEAGATCRITWAVTEDDISGARFVEISLVGVGPWHRSAGKDGNVVFCYVVLPR